MTKEELEKEADDYADKHAFRVPYDGSNKFYDDVDFKASKEGYLAGAKPREKRIAELEAKYLQATDEGTSWAHLKSLEQENEKLKAKIGLSIDCEKAQKNGELCLGYGGDEDEPCERCKNCIKCEGGYYQLGETEKDYKLTKAKEIIRQFLNDYPVITKELLDKLEQFVKEVKENG